jgi:serine/threonine protein phosphatase 1
MSYVAIGDIHGSSFQLARMLGLSDLFSGRRIVFLGDYVDVGRNSKEVIDLLLSFRGRFPDTVFLKGNHDIAMMEYLSGGEFADYAAGGGIATIRSYCGKVYGDVRMALSESVPRDHSEFLSGLRDFFETTNFLFSHSGYDRLEPLDRSVRAVVQSSHLELFSNKSTLPKVAVCGHYFQSSFKPSVQERVICLDTGCGVLNGPLTAMRLPERTWVQVWPDGTAST